MAPGKYITSCKIEIKEAPVRKPALNQVLVRVVAAAINSLDYGAWARCKPEQCPLAMGREGCGVGIQTGEGSLLSSFTTSWTCPVGTKVGFAGLKNKQGSYLEYVVADAVGVSFPCQRIFPLKTPPFCFCGSLLGDWYIGQSQAGRQQCLCSYGYGILTWSNAGRTCTDGGCGNHLCG
jgi:hypothetical protein